MGYQIGIDIGGTFTDFAVLDVETQKISTHKQLTTPARPAEAVFAGLDVIFSEGRISPDAVESVVHGTTLITNAVIERKGSRVGLIVTRGFSDVIDMGLESRYDMFDLRIRYPDAIVTRRRRIEVNERVLYDGRIETNLDLQEARAAVQNLVENQEVEAIAICLLHSYRTPDHERQIRDIANQMYPNLYISISSEVYPDIREYPRWMTTCINAYTQPVFDKYLAEIEDGLQIRSIHAPLLIMTSNGGTVDLDTARKFPVRALESGPAAGALMSALLGRYLKKNALLSFDMGGTTAKGALIKDGQALKRYEIEVARVHEFKKGSGLIAKIPVIDLVEIGSGGGSIASIDSRGLLAVGPLSCGADPGPACYGRGGFEATLTDANLILGYLGEESFLGGEFKVFRNQASLAIEKKVCQKLNLSEVRAAWGIHNIINEDIAKAFRIHASERGFDYRNSSMIAFGGSGPIHALEVAQKLRIPQVVFPVGAGVMSALGLLASPLSFEEVQYQNSLLENLTLEAYENNFNVLKSKVGALMDKAGASKDDIKYYYSLDMRYSGQGYDIEVPLGSNQTLCDTFPKLEKLFCKNYANIYSDVSLTSPIEVTTWKIKAVVTNSNFPNSFTTWSKKSYSKTPKSVARSVYFPSEDRYVDTTVLMRSEIEPYSYFDGPIIIEETETTIVVGPKFSVFCDGDFNLIAKLVSN